MFAAIIAVACFAAGVYFAPSINRGQQPGLDLGIGGAQAAQEAPPAEVKAGPTPSADSVELAESQLKGVKVETVGERDFPIEKIAVGSIDFNEELLTQVFTPYQGRIVGLFAKIGDEVKSGQTLFTIDSPDLLNADSNLIAAAGVLELTTRNLTRLRALYATRAVSQKDLEQGI
jgi:cobalt-zinc-cadmium efflux system membrane fusion protein